MKVRFPSNNHVGAMKFQTFKIAFYLFIYLFKEYVTTLYTLYFHRTDQSGLSKNILKIFNFAPLVPSIEG